MSTFILHKIGSPKYGPGWAVHSGDRIVYTLEHSIDKERRWLPEDWEIVGFEIRPRLEDPNFLRRHLMTAHGKYADQLTSKASIQILTNSFYGRFGEKNVLVSLRSVDYYETGLAGGWFINHFVEAIKTVTSVAKIYEMSES